VGELASLPWTGGSDELDLERTVEVLAEKHVLEDADVVVRERVRQRRSVVLVVDVSGSMRADDVKPTRLDAAAHAMSVFATRVPRSLKLGLVAFSSEPDVLVPPTTDRNLLQQGISLLGPEGGTAIGDALKVAVLVAKASVGSAPRNRDGKIPAAIVLLSDGAQTRGTLTPLQGAEFARRAGIRVFTIALGTNHGVLTIPNNGLFSGGLLGGGQSVLVKPDPVTLAAIARETGGQTFRAQSAQKVDHVYKLLGATIARHEVKREVGSWFAGAAAFLLLGSIAASRALAGRLP
jgi:Ca-activated chloride channel family protein